jgi:hypothetical protein
MAVTVKPPTTEIGVQTQPVPQPARGTGGGPLTGWTSFIDEHEYVPELIWPASIPKYHQMRSDAQIDALHVGSTMPIREMRWSLDPNGCSAALTEQAAEDFGLPIRGHEDDNVPMASYRFNFDEFLSDALLSLLYGHMYFEQVAYLDGDAIRMRKMAPRHPRTIGSFVLDPSGDGGLVGIRQNIARWQNIGTGQSILVVPPIIPIERMVAFVWRREAGSWIGRSMLRSIYREWMVKDRTIRIAAVNLERAGGMPVIEGPQGASDPQLADLAQMARQFKVAEGGGGAIPFGSKLHLVGGNAPAATDLIRYCDEAMARVWALMIIQLGQTQTGSRALGRSFHDYAAAAQRAIAGWVARIFDEHVLKDYVEWNNPASKYAPRLHFEQGRAEALSVADMVSLITAGALTVDPELEAWIRDENGLPDRPEGEGQILVPEASRLEAPGAEQLPAPAPAPSGAPAPPGTAAALSRRPREVRAMTLPARKLRRQPYDVEVRAAVDFGGLEAAFDSSAADAERLYREVVIPAQIDALEDQVRMTKSGDVRQRVTRSAMAALQAPGAGRDELATILLDAARTGALTALGEAQAQGLALEPVEDAVLAQLVGDQADAMTKLGADGLSLAAARKATSLVGGGRTPDQLAAEMGQHLRGMKHTWSVDQLKGAINQAQNAGRFEVMRQVEGEGVSFYISALLDVNCCAACIADDGREFPTIEAMRTVLPSGGNVRCEGGPRCRCTGVMVRDEQSPLPSSNPVVPLPALA